MEWNASDIALLKGLWTKGRSAGQIATRLGHGRNALCGKLQPIGLKRGHKAPTAKLKIVSAPKHGPQVRPSLLVRHLCRSRPPSVKTNPALVR